MTVPKPSSGESESDFISRCMSDSHMKSTYNQNQRLAVCYNSYRTNKQELTNIAKALINFFGGIKI